MGKYSVHIMPKVNGKFTGFWELLEGNVVAKTPRAAMLKVVSLMEETEISMHTGSLDIFYGKHEKYAVKSRRFFDE